MSVEIEVDDDYVKIAQREGSEFMEFPIENDGSILLSTIQAQFPHAIGLKYRSSSGAWRAIREANNTLDPPKGGWGNRVYCLTLLESKESNERVDDPVCTASKPKIPLNPFLQDLAVIGLPYKTTNAELKDYFERNYGELAFSEVKLDRDTGESRGFGFIRFKEETAARAASGTEHYIDGRKVEVKRKQDKPMKMFIGRLPQGTTIKDLDTYFSQYGDLTDTYIPQPFRNFAFITFASSEAAKNCMRDTHVLCGNRINVMERNPQEKDKSQQSGEKNDVINSSNNSSFSGGGFGTSKGFGNPKSVTHDYMDYQSQSNTNGSDNDQLKQMLFQFLANQK